MTVVVDWLSTYDNQRTQDGYKRYTGYVLAWLDAEGIKLQDITPRLFNLCAISHGWKGCHKRNAIIAMRSLITYAFGKAHLFLELKVPTHKPKPQRTLTSDELDKLVRSIKTKSKTGAI